MYKKLKLLAIGIIIFALLNYVYRKELFQNDDSAGAETEKDAEVEEIAKLTAKVDAKDIKENEPVQYEDDIDIFAGLLGPEMRTIKKVLDGQIKADKMKTLIGSITKRINAVNFKILNKEIKKNKDKQADILKQKAANLLILKDSKFGDSKKNKQIKKLAKIIKKKVMKKIPTENVASLDNLTPRENQLYEEITKASKDEDKQKFGIIIVKINDNIIRENNRKYNNKLAKVMKIQNKAGKRTFKDLVKNRKKQVIVKQIQKVKNLVKMIKGQKQIPGELSPT